MLVRISNKAKEGDLVKSAYGNEFYRLTQLVRDKNPITATQYTGSKYWYDMFDFKEGDFLFTDAWGVGVAKGDPIYLYKEDGKKQQLTYAQYSLYTKDVIESEKESSLKYIRERLDNVHKGFDALLSIVKE